ncbi:hypothetical protein H4Q26_001489 [Puccinia striiformis f. sp. tritici PST-130]|nr:hypothetical protein H4Q26_001489 [Puccinia striiformis f. sp. tritici PST-130]
MGIQLDLDDTGSSYPIPPSSDSLLYTQNSSQSSLPPGRQPLPSYHNQLPGITGADQDYHSDQETYRATGEEYDDDDHDQQKNTRSGFNNMPPRPITGEQDPFTHSIGISSEEEEEQGYAYDRTEDEKEAVYANIVLEDSTTTLTSSPPKRNYAYNHPPANPHWGPAPAGRALRRNRTRKRVDLTDGNWLSNVRFPQDC